MGAALFILFYFFFLNCSRHRPVFLLLVFFCPFTSFLGLVRPRRWTTYAQCLGMTLSTHTPPPLTQAEARNCWRSQTLSFFFFFSFTLFLLILYKSSRLPPVTPLPFPSCCSIQLLYYFCFPNTQRVHLISAIHCQLSARPACLDFGHLPIHTANHLHPL